MWGVANLPELWLVSKLSEAGSNKALIRVALWLLVEFLRLPWNMNNSLNSSRLLTLSPTFAEAQGYVLAQ